MPPWGGRGRAGRGTPAHKPALTWVFLARLPVPSGSCLVPRTTWYTSGTCRPRRSYRNYRATQVSAGICAGRTPASTWRRCASPCCLLLVFFLGLWWPAGDTPPPPVSERLACGFELPSGHSWVQPQLLFVAIFLAARPQSPCRPRVWLWLVCVSPVEMSVGQGTSTVV